jgi:hypothetical protein
VRHDDADKLQLWAHPKKSVILSLLSPRAPASQLLEALCFCKKVAFCSMGSVPQLVEPRLLGAVSELLHPQQDPAVLLRCLRFLRMAASSPAPGDVAAWCSVAFKLAPLLSLAAQHQFAGGLGLGGGPGGRTPTSAGSSASSAAGGAPGPSRALVCEAALLVLLNLSEHGPFRNALFASGEDRCPPPPSPTSLALCEGQQEGARCSSGAQVLGQIGLRQPLPGLASAHVRPPALPLRRLFGAAAAAADVQRQGGPRHGCVRPECAVGAGPHA